MLSENSSNESNRKKLKIPFIEHVFKVLWNKKTYFKLKICIHAMHLEYVCYYKLSYILKVCYAIGKYFSSNSERILSFKIHFIKHVSGFFKQNNFLYKISWREIY